jgi:hypothetical protein
VYSCTRVQSNQKAHIKELILKIGWLSYRSLSSTGRKLMLIAGAKPRHFRPTVIYNE